MKISVFFLFGVALILMAFIEDCNGRSAAAKKTKPSSDDSTDVVIEPKKSRRTEPESLTLDENAPIKPKKPKSNRRTKTKTGKKTGPDAIPRSRRPRAIAAEQPELMDMAAEESDTIQDMDLLFPISHDSNSNTVNKFRLKALGKGEEQEPAPRASIIVEINGRKRPFGLMPRPTISPKPGFLPILHNVISNIAADVHSLGQKRTIAPTTLPPTAQPLTKPTTTKKPVTIAAAKLTTKTTTTTTTPEPKTEPADPQAPAEPEPELSE